MLSLLSTWGFYFTGLVPAKPGLFLKFNIMIPQKQIFSKTTFKSPDLSKLTAVIIDHRTTIYIAQGADIEKARDKYLLRYPSRLVK
jgi:hypothetical protein